MPETLIQPRPATRRETPGRKHWTQKECESLIKKGFLTERYELIDGEIIEKMAQKPPHIFVIGVIMEWLAGVFGLKYLRIQASLFLDNFNTLEPDALVTEHPREVYLQRNLAPDEVQLLVEVSDTTLAFDLGKKARLYARAGIQDYWVIDIKGRRIVVHREPTLKGYHQVVSYPVGESLSLLARPDVSVTVAELLPPM